MPVTKQIGAMAVQPEAVSILTPMYQASCQPRGVAPSVMPSTGILQIYARC